MPAHRATTGAPLISISFGKTQIGESDDSGIAGGRVIQGYLFVVKLTLAAINAVSRCVYLPFRTSGPARIVPQHCANAAGCSHAKRADLVRASRKCHEWRTRHGKRSNTALATHDTWLSSAFS
jgi:hypothetical protein